MLVHRFVKSLVMGAFLPVSIGLQSEDPISVKQTVEILILCFYCICVCMHSSAHINGYKLCPYVTGATTHVGYKKRPVKK